MSIPHIVCVFWCFRWASYLRALCSTSGTIRWNTRTGNDMNDIWMQKSGSDSFNMFWYDLSYIKVGMLRVFLWSEVEYENVSFKILTSCVKLEEFFSPNALYLAKRRYLIFALNQSKDWISHTWTHHTSAAPRCVSFLHRTSFHGCLKCARNHHRRTSRLWISGVSSV